MINTDSLKSLAERWPRDSISDKAPTSQPAVRISQLANNEGFLAQDMTDIQTLRQFATINKFHYEPGPFVNKTDEKSPQLPAWLAHSPSGVAVHRMTSKQRGFSVTMQLYYESLRSAYDDSSLGLYNPRGIIIVQLHKQFPQIVLDSNKNDGSRAGISNVAASFKKNQLLNLEGDFNRYFDLYAPRNLQVNSLTLLAPNFMQILIDSSLLLDVEFFGDQMMLTTQQPLFSPSIISLIMQALDTQLAYLQHLEASWTYIPNQPPFDLLEHELLSSNVIKLGKLRIKPKVYNIVLYPLYLLLMLLGFWAVIGIPLLIYILVVTVFVH